MQFVLSHRHAPSNAASRSPPGAASRARCGTRRRWRPAAELPSETSAEHLLIWTVDAESEAKAIALLPPWLAERTEVRLVGEVSIP